jgi:hypothetical protein
MLTREKERRQRERGEGKKVGGKERFKKHN